MPHPTWRYCHSAPAASTSASCTAPDTSTPVVATAVVGAVEQGAPAQAGGLEEVVGYSEAEEQAAKRQAAAQADSAAAASLAAEAAEVAEEAPSPKPRPRAPLAGDVAPERMEEGHCTPSRQANVCCSTPAAERSATVVPANDRDRAAITDIIVPTPARLRRRLLIRHYLREGATPARASAAATSSATRSCAMRALTYPSPKLPPGMRCLPPR
jgi:hypothetical protein